MKSLNNLNKKNDSDVIDGFWKIAYIFFFCAIIGWVWEEAYCLVKHGFWVERGFLFGPWLPIYGLGGMFLYMVWDKLIKNPVLLFLSSIVLAGVIEYAGHYMLEKLFNEKWWDYTGRWLNINGRVHVVGLLFFGIAGCAAVYFAIPPFLRLVSKMKKRTRIILCSIVLSIFSVDVIVSTVVHAIT